VNPARIFEEFPAPAYRGSQRQALADIQAAFQDGARVVLVRAPTGSGKSLLARAIAGCARTPGEADAAEVTDAYYTTPQVSQLDDVAADELLSDLNIIRGKGNYNCILPGETDTPVDQAPCVREREFDCQVKHRCPYFSDRAIASNREIAAMTLAYFMQTAGSDVFGKRDVVVVDEAHGLGEWAEMYATIDLGPDTVPVWDTRTPGAIEDLSDATSYAEGLEHVADRRVTELRQQEELTGAEVAERDRLDELRQELSWFRSDCQDPESPTTWVVDQPDGAGGRVTIKPLAPEKYLKHTVWDRGNRFALLSATILNKQAFCANVGLPPDDVALVDVEHTFPVEQRPLFDVTQGKMTYEERGETLPQIARTVVRLMQHHPDEKGLIHCHSYAIQEELASLLRDFGVAERLRSHETANRDAQLDAWKHASDPDVFLSVKMEEALDLEGDSCRWQVICKAPYPNTRDSRVAQRLADDQWGWYYRSALRTVIQACGRVVRSPNDYGATYLADSSLLDLFERARSDMPGWFEAQVDRMEAPSLPRFSPADAVAGNSDSSMASGSGATAGRQRSHSGSDRSPMADVWDTE
jgi:Rad3-related DNA helicase